MIKIKYYYVLIILLLISVIVFAGYAKILTYLSLENLHNNKHYLKNIVNYNYLISVIVFIIIYILAAVLLVPDTAVFQLAGGFLFGVMPGIIYVNLGATIGAAATFLISRWLIGEWVQKKYENDLIKFNDEMKNNGHNYLLTMRLLPVMPFFLTNILAGLAKIRFITFVRTTALGMFPGLLIYTYLGTQLNNISSMKDIMTGKMIFIFVLLTILAFMPTILNRIKYKINKF